MHLPQAFIHRKRKADSSAEDQMSPSLRLDVGLEAPRQPTLSTEPSGLWSSPSSPHPLSSEVMFGLASPPAKRPRVEPAPRSPTPVPRRYMRRNSPSNSKILPSRPPPIPRLGNDVEDIGIVSTAAPGPSSGSLIRAIREGSLTSKPPLEPVSPSTIPLIPIDPNSLHIPPSQPLINRQTLKELQLDSILRNPQLRHDILFDSGLQFRPTNGRRKREVSERYWNAVTLELETGCTCVSFDMQGQPHPVFCACHHVSIPTQHPVMAYSPPFGVVTLRMPSRIRPLLSEFLQVLLLVIQPLASVNPETYVNPETLSAQLAEQTSQAAHIQSILDPALIEQELKHKVFDPSGLFRAIGSTLKAHCAPMRDQAVEAMVQVAETCSPGGTGTTADAVKAVSMCLDILEQMKLDIANHQLTTLRPFLVRTAGHFELKAFKNTKSHDCSLRVTREWLRTAHCTLLSRDVVVRHARFGPSGLHLHELSRNQQVYLAAVSAITDLVFNPPSEYPETTYLDFNRIQLLATESADITATNLLLLLYRQLVLSAVTPPPTVAFPPRIDNVDLLTLKTEIREIGSRVGYYFSNKPDKPKNQAKWTTLKQDLVLQTAMRAEHKRRRGSQPISSSPASINEPPSERLLSLATHWADANLHASSPLATMLRGRLRDTVFNSVAAMTFPGRNGSTGKMSAAADVFDRNDQDMDMKLGADMDVLAPEIRTLAAKISRLVLVHLNAYLPLYEHERFLDPPS